MDKEALPIVSNIYDFTIFLDSFIINSVPQNDCTNNNGKQNIFKEIFPLIPPNGRVKIKSHIVINKKSAIATSSYCFITVLNFNCCPI